MSAQRGGAEPAEGAGRKVLAAFVGEALERRPEGRIVRAVGERLERAKELVRVVEIATSPSAGLALAV